MFAFNFFQPVTDAMLGLLNAIHSVIPSYGLDMLLLALVVRLALFPLAQQQFKSMAEMQKVQPLLKRLQVEHKGKPQELQAATMALYKEHGVNPLAGCFPMLIQLPILLGLFYAINQHVGCHPKLWDAAHQLCDKVAGAAPGDFWTAHFLWIGSSFSLSFPQIFATSLATLDMPLFVLYIVSMYISVRYGSPPSSDPQQAQTQKIMAIVSPAMIAYFGWRWTMIGFAFLQLSVIVPLAIIYLRPPPEMQHEAAAIADMSCLPPALAGRKYYEPKERGFEKEIKRRLDGWEEIKRKRKSESQP